eukprot:GHVT01085681.1.p1 GENE.GHVT01085681.1~~GHVT01085681.1.p1  ORF type:complete len:384 (-),score=50.10 GHVT01085681.1:112-1263(-)
MFPSDPAFSEELKGLFGKWGVPWVLECVERAVMAEFGFGSGPSSQGSCTTVVPHAHSRATASSVGSDFQQIQEAQREPKWIRAGVYEEVDDLIENVSVDTTNEHYCLPPLVCTVPLHKSSITTIMLRHLPLMCTKYWLVHSLREKGFGGKVNFVYMPMDFKKQTIAGYAFVSFLHPSFAQECKNAFAGKDIQKEIHEGDSCGPPSFCQVFDANLQGLRENFNYYRNTTFVAGPNYLFKPSLFYCGVEVPWPEGDRSGVPGQVAQAVLGCRRAGVTIVREKMNKIQNGHAMRNSSCSSSTECFAAPGQNQPAARDEASICRETKIAILTHLLEKLLLELNLPPATPRPAAQINEQQPALPTDRRQRPWPASRPAPPYYGNQNNH